MRWTRQLFLCRRRVAEGRGVISEPAAMPSVAFLVPLALMNAVIAVEGDAECPSAQAVDVELSRILAPPTRPAPPPSPTSGPGDRASVSRSEQAIHVALRTKDGSLVGEREVTAEGSCE